MKGESNPVATTVRRVPSGPATWDDLVKAACAQFGWTLDTEVFVYVETATECALTKLALALAEPTGMRLEGRIFDPAGELRWVAREDGRFDAWLVDEGDGERAKQSEQTYFLLGRGVEVGGSRFAEGRYPGKIFSYPVVVPGPVADQARAYVRVREYFRPAPTEAEWNAMSDAEAVRLLNEPLLIEHRFLDLGVE